MLNVGDSNLLMITYFVERRLHIFEEVKDWCMENCKSTGQRPL